MVRAIFLAVKSCFTTNNYWMIVWLDRIAAESSSGLGDVRLASKQGERRSATPIYVYVNVYSYFHYKYCILDSKEEDKLYNKTHIKATCKSCVLIAYPFTFGIMFIFSLPLQCREFLWILLMSEVMLKWLIPELLWRVFIVTPTVYDSIDLQSDFFPVISSGTH